MNDPIRKKICKKCGNEFNGLRRRKYCDKCQGAREYWGIDLIGQRFGLLTVIERGDRVNKRMTWRCICDCGNERIVPTGGLRSGQIHHCGSSIHITKNNYKKALGSTIGRFLVIKYIYDSDKSVKHWFKCKCECGTIGVYNAASLMSGHTLSCGCLRIDRIAETQQNKILPNNLAQKNLLFNRYKKEAKRRGYVFDLKRDYFETLISENCFYCNTPPLQFVNLRGRKFRYNGIDRMNNLLGYTKENSVPCCKICNKMKLTMGVRDFSAHIKKINDHFCGKITVLKIAR